MAEWQCPNKAKVAEHPKVILFKDEKRTALAYMQVPKPAYCDICGRYYTRAECTKVDP